MDGNRARALLGVPAHATTDAVRRAFRAAAAVAHPDRGGDPVRFRALVAARAVLLASSPAPPRPSDGAWVAHLGPPVSPLLDVVDVARRPAATAPPSPPSFDEVLAAVLAA